MGKLKGGGKNYNLYIRETEVFEGGGGNTNVKVKGVQWREVVRKGKELDLLNDRDSSELLSCH